MNIIRNLDLTCSICLTKNYMKLDFIQVDSSFAHVDCLTDLTNQFISSIEDYEIGKEIGIEILLKEV